MSAGAITAIVIVVLAALAPIAAVAGRQARTRRLKRRFGAEYYRLVDDRQSRKKAEAELIMRQRHVSELHIQPLEPDLRDRFAADWAVAQEKFVDAPASAVVDAQHVVSAVLQSRGYPLTHREQVISDLSVEHAATLDFYRSACDVSARIGAGTASTEELRQAMIGYRTLFDDLIGRDSQNGSGKLPRFADSGPRAATG